MFRPIPTCVALALLLGGCAAAPRVATLRRAPGPDVLAGASSPEFRAHVRRELGVLDDKAQQRLVQDIGARLAALSARPHLHWRFVILDVAAANAFASRTGHVCLTRGILPYLDGDAELAAILGDAVAHVASGHLDRLPPAAPPPEPEGLFCPVARRFRADDGTMNPAALFTAFSADEEAEAAVLASMYLARAGWDPSAVPSALAALGHVDVTADRRGVPTWVTTHADGTDLPDRVREAIGRAGERPPAGGWKTGRDTYLQRVRGLVFGDDPREGLVRGNEFVHPGLRVALGVPADWDVSHDWTRMLARKPGGDAYLILEAVPVARQRDVKDVATALASRAGLQPVGAGMAAIGSGTYSGVYEGQDGDLGRIRVRVGCLGRAGRTFLVAGLAPVDRFPSFDALFESGIRSLRALDAGEVTRVRPHRLATDVVQAGDTWDSIARRNGGAVLPGALAAINHADPAGRPAPGTTVKVVVVG